MSTITHPTVRHKYSDGSVRSVGAKEVEQVLRSCVEEDPSASVDGGEIEVEEWWLGNGGRTRDRAITWVLADD